MRFYKAKIILIVSFLVVGLFGIPAHAGTNTNCISAQNGRSSMSSSTLTLSADLYWNCTDAPMSGGVTYSISEDSSVYCTGPSYADKAARYGNTYAGVVSCAINIVNSGRAGASTSTLRIWSAYDFSTKYITIYHQQIPSKFTPIPVPIPTFTPTPSPSFSSPANPPGNTGSTSTLQIKQNCTKGKFASKWHCIGAPMWEYSVCSSLKKGSLQKFSNKKWKTVIQLTGEKNEYYCSNLTFPYYVANIPDDDLPLGSYKYRLYFPNQSNKKGYTDEFTLRVLMGDVDKNAL
jgi:hypothetical protein